jgi:ribosome maturation factor RimP
MQNLTRLRALLEPPVEALGYELLHLEFAGRKGGTLRLYIDAPGGIEVDDCETVSRQVSLVLDVEDPVQDAYTLEVSSPGLDRPLVKPEHFRRFAGEKVRIVMQVHVLGRRRFTGTLVAADENGAEVEVDGESYSLPYEDMESARLEPVFDMTGGGRYGRRA